MISPWRLGGADRVARAVHRSERSDYAFIDTSVHICWRRLSDRGTLRDGEGEDIVRLFRSGLLVVALVGLLVPSVAVAQEATPSAEVGAVDLAAMALAPSDLPWPGFGLSY